MFFIYRSKEYNDPEELVEGIINQEPEKLIDYWEHDPSNCFTEGERAEYRQDKDYLLDMLFNWYSWVIRDELTPELILTDSEEFDDFIEAFDIHWGLDVEDERR